jgi:hypothetical protein
MPPEAHYLSALPAPLPLLPPRIIKYLANNHDLGWDWKLPVRNDPTIYDDDTRPSQSHFKITAKPATEVQAPTRILLSQPFLSQDQYSPPLYLLSCSTLRSTFIASQPNHSQVQCSRESYPPLQVLPLPTTNKQRQSSSPPR